MSEKSVHLPEATLFLSHVLLQTVQLCVEVVQLLAVQCPHVVLLVVLLLPVPDIMVVQGEDMVVVLSCRGVSVLVLMVVHSGADQDTVHRQLL